MGEGSGVGDLDLDAPTSRSEGHSEQKKPNGSLHRCHSKSLKTSFKRPRVPEIS